MLRLVLSLSLVFGTAWIHAKEMNEPAPDFTLKSRQGENLRLEDFRGQVVMLNFWASWCGPCRQEMPLMDDIYEQYKDLGFTVLAVNVDENREEAHRFLDKVPVSYPILYDPESQVSEQYNVQAMPTTVMIDRNGNARFLHHGYKPGYEDEYEKQIRQLVRE
ncbi:TlpA disulfide reductase family protein [Marinobacter sp. CHS3-4]|uniref:TlpA family protein disulfide reductase n=1 Tax=Marinobacter sp. CHS3-4 TaxID=3045174 RepID=UPI0024B5C094|nr:TlpA disulfide reductase family protein [Marinobacter sp. CHS3-4]MDI9245744.1 TlpA disulfide reductase family protein [Marinobacter sp. CHS3-4]